MGAFPDFGVGIIGEKMDARQRQLAHFAVDFKIYRHGSEELVAQLRPAFTAGLLQLQHGFLQRRIDQVRCLRLCLAEIQFVFLQQFVLGDNFIDAFAVADPLHQRALQHHQLALDIHQSNPGPEGILAFGIGSEAQKYHAVEFAVEIHGSLHQADGLLQRVYNVFACAKGVDQLFAVFRHIFQFVHIRNKLRIIKGCVQLA